MKVHVRSLCDIWSGNKSFNEVCQWLFQQTNFPVHSNLAYFTDTHFFGKLIITHSLLCPWGKKAFNSTSSDNRQPVNMDTFYGPFSTDIKEVWQHHIFMNTSEGNYVGIIIFTTYYYNIYKHPPLDCSSK